ncbi:MAG: hypothetical protein M9894_13550 [Planctomycetes bacterium]|nr:hypothetical protein [Planctomycetota bacterium]
MTLLRATLALALLAPLPGCLSREDLDRAMDDQTRFSGRVMGFALDAHQETLRAQLALLRAFEGQDEVRIQLEQHLGSAAEVEAKLERVRQERRSLIEESQRLRERYRPAGGE